MSEYSDSDDAPREPIVIMPN